jgi:hypothetical protein
MNIEGKFRIYKRLNQLIDEYKTEDQNTLFDVALHYVSKFFPEITHALKSLQRQSFN